MAEGAYDAAAQLLPSVPPPSQPEDLVRLGRIYDGLGEDEEAERFYRSAIEAGLDDAIVELTLLLDELGRSEEVERLLASRPDDAQVRARIARGRSLRADGDVERALDEYRRGVELGDVEALRLLAGTLSHAGRAEEAEAIYRDPPFGRADPTLTLDHALHLVGLDRAGEAETILRELVLRDAPGSHLVLGNLLDDLPGREDDAIDAYVAGIAAGDPQCWTNLGVTWLYRDELAAAEVALRHAWSMGDPLAGRSLGRLLLRTDRVEEARSVLQDAAQAGDEPSQEELDALAARSTEADRHGS